MIPEEFFVEAGDEGGRFDRFLGLRMPSFSRVRLQEFIRGGDALLNGSPARPSQNLRLGDKINVAIPADPLPCEMPAQDIPLDILYEDASIVVLNKPAGLVVHPGAGNADGTVVNALLHHCGGIAVIGGVERPGIVHRLDKETSGCLVAAKTDAAHHSLSEQFAGRQVEKVYLALVEGCPRMPHGTISAAISRHKIHRQRMAVDDRGREAVTHYRVLASQEGKALVECRPKTGRTHQIRVHLKHIGHGIVGDPVYGRRGTHLRHFLHAWKLSFEHPADKSKVTFTAPIPADFPAWAAAALLPA